MLRYMSVMVGCLVLLLGAGGCRTAGGGGAGALTPARELDLLVEEGDAATMGEKQYRFRTELRDYMQRDLPRRFARCGMNVRVVGQRAESVGRDLLVVRYTSYNPGSSAARIAVGYGVGAASLDIQATLFSGGQQTLEWTDGCGTSGHWSRIVNKLDDNMAKKLLAHYRQ